MSRKGQLELQCETNQSLGSVCVVCEKSQKNTKEFVINSCCTDHIVFDTNLFVDFRKKKDVVLNLSGKQFQIKELVGS